MTQRAVLLAAGRWTLAGALLLAAAALGCSGGAEGAGEAAPGASLHVESPRAFAPPGSGTVAVYLTLVNPTREDDVLLAAATPVALMAHLHRTVEEDGVLRMEGYPDGLPVPAGERTVLAPGGSHVMLMALEGPLEPGATVPLTLTFEKAGEIAVQAPVVADPESAG